MSAEKQKRSRSVAFTPDASDYETHFSDLMEVNSSDTDDDVMSVSANESTKSFLETQSGKTPRKKGPKYFAKLQEKFHRSRESSSPKSPEGLLSPKDCLTKKSKYSSRLSPILSDYRGRRISAPVTTRMDELHSKTEWFTKHIHKRRSAIGPPPSVCILVNSEEEVTGDLRKSSRPFGSTGNLLDMSDDLRRTNLTKKHLAKSLQQVGHTDYTQFMSP